MSACFTALLCLQVPFSQGIIDGGSFRGLLPGPGASDTLTDDSAAALRPQTAALLLEVIVMKGDQQLAPCRRRVTPTAAAVCLQGRWIAAEAAGSLRVRPRAP